MRRRLLITGGSGYLGRALAQQAAAGWDTVATYHRAPLGTPGVTWLALDLRDAPAAERAIAGQRPDVIIHTAYVQDGPDLEAITVAGSAAAARAARSCGARLIHLSSDVIFSGEHDGRYADDDPPAPISAYGRAKAAAEDAVRAAAPAALIARTSLIYGGDEPSKHEQLAIDAAAGRAAVRFFSDEMRCPVAVGDLAAALLELAALDVTGVLNVAGADAVSRYEFAQLVVRASGGDPAALQSAISAQSATPRPRNCALDSSRAQALLATRLRGAREVLRLPTE